MKRTLLYFSLLVGLLPSICSSCTKDIIDTTGNLSGYVSDARNQTPLSGVSISITPGGKTYTTGADGKYEFRDIESGQYTVDVSKNGYKSDRKNIFVQVEETSTLDFQLMPATGSLSLSQNSLDFGNTTTTLAFDIINTESSDLNWQLSEDAAWLSCNPTSGTTHSGEMSSVVVTVDREGLERGNYSQTIAVSSDGGSAIIDVVMAVQGLTVSISPEELDFGSTTSSMELNITNNGSGNISYTISPSNGWIKLSRTTGTFSRTENITVSVDRTSLSEGDHSGSLSLSISDDKITIPVRMNIPSKEKPVVSMQFVENVTFSGAFAKGAIANIGSAKVTRYGFCWSTDEEPTVNSKGVCNLGDTDKAKDFTYSLTSLESNTTYYIRAYAENAEGLSYSNRLKFTTSGTPQLASLETGNVTSLQAMQVQISGNILNLGNTPSLSQYGHVWSTTANPTTANSKTELGSTSNTGTFNSTLTKLSANTKYFVRAYAINSVGTAYGNEISLTTLMADAVINTGSVKNITHNSAAFYAEITSTGGHSITEKGFCWSSASNPTISGNSIKSTAEAFTVQVSGLSPNTTYHVRAYVKTEDNNIFYGNDVMFSTTDKNAHIDKNGFGNDNNWTR